jgi:hypothetical protein
MPALISPRLRIFFRPYSISLRCQGNNSGFALRHLPWRALRYDGMGPEKIFDSPLVKSMPASSFYLLQRLLDIPEDVVDMFESHGQADEIRRHPCGRLLGRRQLLMRRRGRMDGQCLCVPHIG